MVLRHSVLKCLSSFPGLHLVGVVDVSYISLPAEGDPQILKLDLHGQILKQIHNLFEMTSMSPIPANFRIGRDLRDGLGVSGPGGWAGCYPTRAERPLPIPS